MYGLMSRGPNRRQVLAGGIAAGAVWSAPSIALVNSATAAAQTGPTPPGPLPPGPCRIPDPDGCVLSGSPPWGEVVSALATAAGDTLSVAFEWTEAVVPAVSTTMTCCNATESAGLDPCVGAESTKQFDGCEVSGQSIRDLCGPGLPARAIVRWFFSEAGATTTLGRAVVEAEIEATGSLVQILGQRVRTDLGGVCVPVPATEPDPETPGSPEATRPGTSAPGSPSRPTGTPARSKVPKFSG